MTGTLTPRQRDVVRCIGAGMSYRETAISLGMARDTVRAHVFAILTKIPNPNGLPQKAAVQQFAAELLKAS